LSEHGAVHLLGWDVTFEAVIVHDIAGVASNKSGFGRTACFIDYESSEKGSVRHFLFSFFFPLLVTKDERRKKYFVMLN